MKRLSQSITLASPLHGALLAQPGDSETLDARIREREAASYARGRLEAEQAAAEELQRERARFAGLRDAVLRSLGEGVATVARDSEAALIALTLAAARKLVAGLPITEEQVAAVVRESLAEIEDKAQIRVLLHPEDLALLEQAGSPLLNTNIGGDRMRLESSSEVTRGGCLVQTRLGVIDGRRETKLEMLRQALEP
jgi:flagellar biosynthesis/type III secretory pathway protein FliH